MNDGSPLNVDALHHEADRIQAWLARGPESQRPELQPTSPWPLGSAAVSPLRGAASGDGVAAWRRALAAHAFPRRSASPLLAPGRSSRAAISAEDAEALRREASRLRVALDGAAPVQADIAGGEARLQQLSEAAAGARRRLEAQRQQSAQEVEALVKRLREVAALARARGADLRMEQAEQEFGNAELAQRLAACRGRQTAESERGRKRVAAETSTAQLRRFLHERAGRIRELAERASSLEGGLAEEPSAADVGAQQDAIRILERALASLRPEAHALSAEESELRDRAHTEEGCAMEERRRSALGEDGANAEALSQLQARLLHLREDYASTALRCEGLERRLASEERETDVEVELREAMAEEARLGCSSSDLADLAERLLEARARCAEVLREESRLQAAADEDRSAMDRLRQQLRRSRAREAGLEAEAQFLAADAVR